MNRRRFLATLGTGTLTLAGCTGSTTGPDATPTPRPDEPLAPVEGTWSTYQYDAARTGYNPSRGAPHEERSGHWSADIGEAGDRVAVADGTIYVGNTDGTLYGLESSTGSEQWSLDLLSRENGNDVPWETMTVSDGTLFAGNTWELHAVDPDSREIVWSVKFEGEVPHGETVIVNDVVVAQLGGATVAGLDASTGDITWEFDRGGDDVETNFASDGSSVYFLTYDKRLYALDYQTGDVSWDVTVEDIGRLPRVAVADGRLFLAGGLIVAVDAESGQREWTFHPGEMSGTHSRLPVGRAAASGGPQASAPAIADGHIFVKTGETRKGVALEVESGHLQWSVETDRWVQPPVVAGDSVYIASGNVIKAYELSSGDSTGWIFKPIADVGSIVVVDGVVFATGGRGYLQALTGTQTRGA